MKNVKLILSCLVLLTALSVSAQNYGRNSNINRNIASENSKLENDRYKEEYEKEKQKNVQKSIEKLKTDLQLDELQTIAVKQIITESIKTEGIILKKEGTDEDKMNAIKGLSETTDIKVKAILNKEQITKFNEIRENANKKRK